MRLLLPLGLVGCGAPFSNALFSEDSLFLEALPTQERIGAPTDIRLARVGNSPILAQAIESAADLQDHVDPLLASADVLVSQAPTERSAQGRFWEPTLAAVEIGGDTYDYWLEAEVLRPSEAGDVEWTMRGSSSPDGPFEDIAYGFHDPNGRGSMSLALNTFVELVAPGESEDLYELQVSYDDRGGEDGRTTEIVHQAPSGIVRQWTVADSVLLGWTGFFAVTEDDETWPGSTVAVHFPEGGRSKGAVVVGEEALTWETCWTAQGDRVWISGDPGIIEFGTEAACAVSDIL